MISLCAKYEIEREESQKNQNGAENTNPENRRIASLLAEINFQLFCMVTAYKMMELKRNLSMAAYGGVFALYYIN